MPIRDFDTIGQLEVVDRFSYDSTGASNITADDVIGALDDLDAAAGGGGGSGDVTGPASATDNALARFDGAGGKTIQNSTATLDDTGNLAIPGEVTLSVAGQDFKVIADGNNIEIQSQSAAQGAEVEIANRDNDGTDDIFLTIDAAGNPGSADFEVLRVGWSAASSAFVIRENTQGTGVNREIRIETEGNASQLVCQTGGGVSIANSLTIGGTVDGRDVAADGTKLDGIEALADVTDATNVDAAGAVMESDLGSGSGFQSYAFGSWSVGRTIQGGTGIDLTNGNGISGNPSVAVDSTVLTDSTFGTSGVMTRTGAGSYTSRTITAAKGMTVSNGDGVLGNPTIAINAALADLSNIGTLTTDEMLYWDGTTVQSDPVPPQMCALQFASSTAGSGVVYLRSGVANNSTGINGSIQQRFHWAGSVVGFGVFAKVTAYTSGNMECEIFVRDGDASWTVLHEEILTVTAAGDFRDSWAYSPGTHTFSADTSFGCRANMSGSGSMTADDFVFVVYVMPTTNIVSLT